MFNSKKEIVYDDLKKRILINKLIPGYPLNEGDLALEIGVSKTPVREALRILESEGYVENVSGRGAMVSYINSSDIHDMFQLREIIEAGAAKKASFIENKRDLNEKRVELLKIAADEENNYRYVEALGEWEDVHYLIIKSLGNHALLNFYQDLLDNITRVKNYYKKNFTERRLKNILDEHISILDAIIERNADEAEKRMLLHLRKAGEFIESVILSDREYI